MIRLKNGFTFKFVGASGALGWDGLGWSHLKLGLRHPKYWCLSFILRRNPDLLVPVIKTLTLFPKSGQDRAIYDDKEWVANAIGLGNPGFNEWNKRYGRKINRPFFLSVAASNVDEIRFLAHLINAFRKTNSYVKGIEFNCSCPNVERSFSLKEITTAVYLLKAITHLPIGIKIGYGLGEELCLRIAQKTQFDVEWISFNSIPWKMVFPDRESPLRKIFGKDGAVSGGQIYQLNKKLAQSIKKQKIRTPIVASSVGWGKTFGEGYQNFLETLEWADGISFGSLFRRHPLWPVRMIQKYKRS